MDMPSVPERSFENSLPRNSFATTWAGFESPRAGRESEGGKACEGALGMGQKVLLLIDRQGPLGGPVHRPDGVPALLPASHPPGMLCGQASPWLLPTLGRPA